MGDLRARVIDVDSPGGAWMAIEGTARSEFVRALQLLPDFVLHSLRRTFGTQATTNGDANLS